jgi:integrase
MSGAGGTVVSRCTRSHRKAEGRCGPRCLRWYPVVELPPAPGGRRRRTTLGGYATKTAARAALRAEQARRDQGITVEPSRLTLAGYAARYLDGQAALGRDARTVERARELLDGHVLPALGGVPLAKLGPGHLKALYGRLLRDGARRDGRPGGLSPRTVGHVHRVLHRLLAEAVRSDELLARNVAAAVSPPRVAEAPMVTLDQGQAAALLAAAASAPPWLGMLVTLGLATGARRGELLALRWAEVDLEDGTATISRTLRLVAGRLDTKQPKTAAGVRVVPLGAFALAALRRHRAGQASLRLAYGPGYDADADLILARADGRAVRPDYASAAFAALARRAGLPAGVHVHTLRHSAASLLAAAGVPPSDIAAQLGHRDGGALALRVYVHPLAENRRRAAALLDAALGGPAGAPEPAP